MNGKTSTLLGKLASDQVRRDGPTHRQIKKRLKQSWNATPRDKRHAMRQGMKEVLS